MTKVCLQKSVFTKIYHLPVNTSGYTIVFQKCCQSAGIVNIESPDVTGVTYFAKIPTNPIINTGAIFKKDPPFYVRINHSFTYDLSATDADGDSLSYEFCQFYKGASVYDDKPIPTPPPFSLIVFVPPYSYGNPISGSPAIQIDPVTGILSGTPNSLGRYCISVCCHEWRNGVQINTVSREFQLVVTNCATTDVGSQTFTAQELRIFPNPASGVVNIGTDIKGFGIKISDVMGRVIFYEPRVNSSQLIMPINTWAKGMYFVRLEFEDGSYKADKLLVE